VHPQYAYSLQVISVHPLQAYESVRGIIAEMSNPGGKAWHGVRDKRGTEIPQKKFLNSKILCLLMDEEIYIYIYIYIYTHTHTHTHTHDRSWHVDHTAIFFQNRWSRLPGTSTNPKERRRQECMYTHYTAEQHIFTVLKPRKAFLGWCGWRMSRFPSLSLRCVSYRPPSDPYQLATSACH